MKPNPGRINFWLCPSLPFVNSFCSRFFFLLLPAFFPSLTIKQPSSVVSRGAQLPIVWPQTLTHKQAGKQSFWIVTFQSPLLLRILFFKLVVLSLHVTSHSSPSLCTPFCNPPPSMSNHSMMPLPPHLSIFFSSSVFLYLLVARTVFLWWITLSSCML